MKTLCKIVLAAWIGLATLGGIWVGKKIENKIYNYNITQIQKLNQSENRTTELKKQNERFKKGYFWEIAGGVLGLAIGLGVVAGAVHQGGEIRENTRGDYSRIDDDSRSDRWQGGYGGFPG